MKYIYASLLALTLAAAANAQGKLVDRREQAEGWYVPVHGQILVEGGKADDVEVALYKGNTELGRITSKKKGNFELELDIDQVYMVRLIKDGYQEKVLWIDTSLPSDLVDYPDYLCFVNLTPGNMDRVDGFYEDFPSAIIRYSAEKGGFYHSEDYLTHITTKLSGIATAQP
jgi:hypothetical protein